MDRPVMVGLVIVAALGVAALGGRKRKPKTRASARYRVKKLYTLTPEECREGGGEWRSDLCEVKVALVR